MEVIEESNIESQFDLNKLIREIESIDINKEEVKSNLIKNIYKKYYNNLSNENICNFFFEKIGYHNLNLPFETEVRIKAYLQDKINSDHVNYNESFNILIGGFYKSDEYRTFIDNFNKRINRAFVLHFYKNKNNINGFLNACTLEELVIIIR